MVPKWSGMGLGSDLLPGDISQGLGKLALERSCVALGHLKVLWPLHNGHWGLWEWEKEDSAERAGRNGDPAHRDRENTRGHQALVVDTF